MALKNVDKKPKISFGIIVLNGEPFTKYCLRSIYPYAHEIIIVEGATKNAKTISTKDGHSTDSTLKSIEEFIKDEDTEKKVKLITKNGFWEEKDEMGVKCFSKATGNYLWQIDIDEFYLEEDMEKIISLLTEDSSITGISFKMKSFWGGINYTEEGPIFGDIYRVFKFGHNYKYIKHRPPIVIDDKNRDLKKLNWIDGHRMKNYGIYMYHYALIFPKQVNMKIKYYSKTLKKDFHNWAENNYYKLSDPYHINNNYWKISWLKRYNGKQPRQIVKMMEDIRLGLVHEQLRDNQDIEQIINSNKYVIITNILEIYFRFISWCKWFLKKILKK